MLVSIAEKLKLLYGEEKGKKAAATIESLIQTARTSIRCKQSQLWDEKDIFLITYPDSFKEEATPTLTTLNKFLEAHLNSVINGVHILPFYPFSSDRGFSIIDYNQVKQEFGKWTDIEKIGRNYRLMVDLVLNHLSVEHEWFQKFLAGDPKYENYFIWFEKGNIPHEDLKKVIRSRTTPLVTPFKTAKGERYVWTTYSVGDSTDQIDLNYQNPEVLIEIVKIFLNLLKEGVTIFRFDGASGIWKQLGTSCRHLPQTHTIIKLFRQILDEVCPSAIIITEVTTGSLSENINYFGDGRDEANIVYNFSLAPLVLQSYYSASVKHLNEWQDSVNPGKNTNTFFNILDIHDGINIHSAKSFLNDSELEVLFTNVAERGGKFSYRLWSDGQKTVKEMHITWWSALNGKGDESFELQMQKFITSRAIAMSIKGIPAIYYLSLFGKENDISAFAKTKHGRDINRTSLSYGQTNRDLSQKGSRDARIFYGLHELINRRKQLSAFHPNAPQKILLLDDRVFSVLRGEGKDCVLALHNLSSAKIELKYLERVFSLEPYGYIWEKVNA